MRLEKSPKKNKKNKSGSDEDVFLAFRKRYSIQLIQWIQFNGFRIRSLIQEIKRTIHVWTKKSGLESFQTEYGSIIGTIFFPSWNQLKYGLALERHTSRCLCTYSLNSSLRRWLLSIALYLGSSPMGTLTLCQWGRSSISCSDSSWKNAAFT